MPWTTPTLLQVRQMTRDNVTAMVRGAAMIPNNVLRVVSDAMAGLARLVLEFIDWLAKQLMVDLAETEWLDRHGNIWLKNADGSRGRKGATLSTGVILATGVQGSLVPAGSLLKASSTVQFETLNDAYIGIIASSGVVITDPSPINVRSLTGGAVANLAAGETMQFQTPISGVDGGVIVNSEGISGGADEESDDDLRTRVLLRIQNPPMGGDATDYVQWALAVAGVTRAWSFPNEMGIGTMTVRFMMDNVRSDNDGFPLLIDIANVANYLDSVRPVAVKDFFTVAPIPFPINHVIRDLDLDNDTTRAAILVSLQKTFRKMAGPGETWYRTYSENAVAAASGVNHFDLELDGDAPNIQMANSGYMPVMGTITYASGEVIPAISGVQITPIGP